MEKTDSLLLISHVKKSFGTLEVLKDISIDVYKGEWFQFSDRQAPEKPPCFAASISWKGLITVNQFDE